ncbi:MAG: hypothetical protein QXF76_03255 [Candidatus Anstonellales archaeon]
MAVEETAKQIVESPEGMIALAAAIPTAAGAIGAAWAQASIGSAAMGMVAEQPDKAGNVLIWLALPETLIILGLACSFLILSNMVQHK